MDELLKIRNLVFNYKEKSIFNNLSLTLEYNKWYTLIGPNGSGKTTLVKIIAGLLEYDGLIEFNFLSLNAQNIYQIRSKMAVLFDNVDTNIVEDNVLNELTFQMRNMNFSSKYINKAIEEIDEFTGIKKIIDKEVFDLSNSEKYQLILATALINKPKILVLDETFSLLNSSDRFKLYDTILKYKKKNKLTVLNITHNLEDSLIGDNLIVLEDGKIVVNDKIKNVYSSNFLNPQKYKLPFIVELSDALKLYELIDRRYYDMKELVEALWN